MDTVIVPQLGGHVKVDYVPITDSEGRTVLVAADALAIWRAQGRSSITLTIPLATGAAAGPRWLTLTEAARLHVREVEYLTGDAELDAAAVHAARVRLGRACDAGEILHTGERGARRLEPGSLAEWRLRARDAALDDSDSDAVSAHHHAHARAQTPRQIHG